MSNIPLDAQGATQRQRNAETDGHLGRTWLGEWNRGPFTLDTSVAWNDGDMLSVATYCAERHRVESASLRSEVERVTRERDEARRERDTDRRTAGVYRDALRKAEAALAAVKPAVDPRRAVGAVWHEDGFAYVVVDESGRRACIGNALNQTGEQFVRYMPPKECARHGIPYVERGAVEPKGGVDLGALRAAVVDARAARIVASWQNGTEDTYRDACRALADALKAVKS